MSSSLYPSWSHRTTTCNWRRRVMTPRHIFRKVMYAVEGQNSDGVLAAADGTYRLHYGNWTLVVVGTYRTRYKKRQYSKNFVPWAYMFVRSEHEFAYKTLFRNVVDFAQLLFDVQLTVAFGSLDHSAAIANAFAAVWPNIVLLDCYSHVSRKCREKVGLLKRKSFYETNIEINVKQMHRARTPEQFKAISELCLRYWRHEGEREYADWFEKVHLDDRWSRWYMSSAIPTILPSQNALESHNGDIKTCGVTVKKAKTGVVLNNSIPGVFAMVAQDSPSGPFGHTCEGPLLSKMIARAMVHVMKGSFFKKTRTVKSVSKRSILFNAAKYLQTAKGPSVTRDRVSRYIAGKAGKLDQEATVNDITTNYQSLHDVELLNPTLLLSVYLEPTISGTTISTIRSMYRCDCKAFWSTGWLCSHVLAAMHLEKKFTLEQAMSILPTTKASGGQRKIRGPLDVPAHKSTTFTKAFLLAKLEEDPLYVNGWEIAQEFAIDIDGVKQPDQYLVGVIKGYCPGSIYKWRVDFEDGDVYYFACEDLVDIILDTHKRGLDVARGAKAPAVFERTEGV